MSTFLGTSQTETEEIYEAPVYEGYEFENHGAQAIIIESFEDQLAVVAAINEAELHVVRNKAGVEESTIDVILEAAGEGGVIEKIKAGLKKLWGKFMAFLESVGRVIDALTKSSEDFVAKHGDAIKNSSVKSIPLKWYEYTIPTEVDEYISSADKSRENGKNAIDAAISAVEGAGSAEKAKEILDDLKTNRDKYLGLVRGAVLGRPQDSVDAKEFSKELFESFRNGSSEKKEINLSVDKILSDLKDSTKLRAGLKTAKSKVNEIFKGEIATVDKAAKAFKKAKANDGKVEVDGAKVNADSVSVLNGILQMNSTFLNATQTACIQYINAWTKAVKEREQFYRGAIIGTIIAGKKGEGKEEKGDKTGAIEG